MSFDINGQVALVTGANRGIGKAIVAALIEQGAKKVYLAVRDVKSAAEQTSEYGDKVVPVQVDVSSADSIANLAEQATDVTLVVNNAGVLELANPLSADFAQAFAKEVNVNVLGLVHMAQAFSPIIEANQGGAFVQLNSVASIKNFTDLTSYSASKAAAYSVTQGLKALLVPKGIEVLSVHPGPIATDMATQAGMEEMGEPASVVADAIVAALKSGQFHLFPDSMARDFGGAYQSYAESVIEAVE
ncbi:SDR family oxidoreductase [Algibacillus agarilyticus]|uniref:SDR family oxidoreductase n=1 Tax=Algibacillus agarilyticus TaxID=2234133 RepID=UPI000DD025F0|nr:SDR family oxidoreductase [Algibacillus agarilyticus]